MDNNNSFKQCTMTIIFNNDNKYWPWIMHRNNINKQLHITIDNANKWQ